MQSEEDSFFNIIPDPIVMQKPIAVVTGVLMLVVAGVVVNQRFQIAGGGPSTSLRGDMLAPAVATASTSPACTIGCRSPDSCDATTVTSNTCSTGTSCCLACTGRGGTCGDSQQCCSRTCLSALTVCECSTFGEYCATSADCCSGNCNANTKTCANTSLCLPHDAPNCNAPDAKTCCDAANGWSCKFRTRYASGVSYREYACKGSPPVWP